MSTAGWLSAAYCVLVAPLLYFAAPLLSAWLAEAELTAEYATIALRLAPIACLASVPFILSRPVFEGLGRGTPGLVMAVGRYLVLAAPMAWAGMKVGEAYGWPAVAGLVAGLIVASLIMGIVFAAWLQITLSAIKPMTRES